MKSCRKILAALVLVLALAPATFADDGIIYPMVAVTQPAPTVVGVIWPDGIMWTEAAEEVITATGFSLLQSLLTRS